jgi:hypothetical protein
LISYFINPHIRPVKRRIVSWCYGRLLNIVFFNRVKYFNHYTIYHRDLLSGLTLFSTGFSVHSEIIVKLIKSGIEYREFPVELDEALLEGDVSSGFNLRSVRDCLYAIVKIVADVYLWREKFKSK